MKPLVSIIMPVYNVEQYLRETLDSIVNQTYKNFEVICVDDGSTDNSLHILQEYENKDSRFKVIQQKNQYAGVARNNGMRVAKGKYLMFLDSDDLFEKKMLATLVVAAEKNKTDIVFFGFYHFKYDLKHRSLMGIPYSSKVICSPSDHKEDLFRIAQGVPWNKFYSREFVMRTELQFQGLQSNNDVFFSKTVVVEAERILFLNKRLVNYRISNSDSLQGSYKLASGNFTKCILAMYDRLHLLGKYDFYKDSFENYVIESFMLTFNKCEDVEGFKIVCNFIKEAFDKVNMTINTPAISGHSAKKIFEMIIQKDYEQALFYHDKYMRESCVLKDSIEYCIGKKLLKSFRIKNYE